MKPDTQPVQFYLTAASTAAEVGCLLIVTIGAAIGLGLLFDRLLGTNHVFILLLLLGSIPLNLWMIYRYTLYKSRRLSATPTLKEDNLDND